MSYICDLTVNYLKDPCGVDNTPRFSYKIVSEGRGDAQKRRRILVSTDKKMLENGTASVWDSGFENTAESVLIPYGGEALQPVTRYYYAIECETEKGEFLKSAPATFVTGKLSEKFSAKWISLARLPKNTVSAQNS
jgi:alpha-L-rhamnosidase